MPMAHRNRTQWLRQRTIGECHKTKIPTSHEMMNRLQQEACLEGHSGCVNCLEWNQRGNLLASGSDDHNVIIWDAFRANKKNVVETGHQGNVFSVKFMPDFSDTLVATCASDCNVKLTDVATGKNMMNCDSCHDDRVKRLAVHQNQPQLLWSAGEDGYILQYDLRVQHICRSSRPRNLLIDLKTIGSHLAAKCLAVNPIRDEMLAVGSNDIYNRLFDRRYLNQDSGNSCTTYFVPGHLLNSNNRSNHLQSFGTTYLSFSPDGSELLASVHAEQVYLFNTYEPWERYKSFDISLKPLLLDKYPANNKFTRPKQRRPYLYWYDLKNRYSATTLPKEHQALFEEADAKLRGDWKLPKEIFDQLNTLILKIKSCPELYRLRASALINRGWRGDYYQALRDCCSALALKPLDYHTINRLAIIICRLGYKEASNGLLEMIETIQREFGNNNELTCAVNLLKSFKLESDCFVDSPCDDDEFMIDDSNDTAIQPTAHNFISQLFAGAELNLADLERMGPSAQDRKEMKRCSNAYDYSKRFCGHCNMNTDIKEASFFGADGEFIVGGSDDGAFYIWDKETTNIVKAVHADCHILNCVQPHPNICMLATSGIESNVKLWSTQGKICKDIESIETRCTQNQEYISIDPLEAMIMMLYPDRDI